jgi:hypothetical protein
MAGSPSMSVVAGMLVVLAAPAARAFSIDTIVTPGCHEEMTAVALRIVRAELPTAAPLAANRDERALIDDLDFTAPADMRDLGGASLLLGVRDNDLEGQDGSDLTRLALVHGDPPAQRKHCLHGGDSPEPAGTPAALADCRAFILERLDEALDGLDDTGRPDPARRTSLAVHLALRHKVDASLPAFYVHIGQALHAVQDSYAHSYRTPDDAHITAVMNWFDQVNGHYDEATDGPPHATELDRCDDPDDLRRKRRELATESATEVLRISLDATRSRAHKRAAVEDLLDQWLSYSPGCSAGNHWCDAPERAFSGNGVLSGCQIAPPDLADWGSTAVLALIGLAMLRGRLRRHGGTLLVAAGLLALTGSARAEAPGTTPGAAAAAAANVPPPVITPVPEPGPHDRSQPAFGGYVGGAGALTDPALAAALGFRLRANLHWTFGLDLEWNPWLSINGADQVRAGALNLYATAILRMPLAYQRFNLRVTVNLGASRTLIDLYGVPQGSIGPFGALYPLGLEWKATRFFYVVINPLGVAAPIPQVQGIPFWYPQYRATIGLEIYAS